LPTPSTAWTGEIAGATVKAKATSGAASRLIKDPQVIVNLVFEIAAECGSIQNSGTETNFHPWERHHRRRTLRFFRLKDLAPTSRTRETPAIFPRRARRAE
jgi:hypothetical protein